jgi:hypothetical protein
MFTDDYSDWEIISEEKIVQALEMCETIGDPSQEDMSNFKKVLSAGKIYKEAGMTPVYVFDDLTCRLAVYANETYQKILH